MPNVVIFLDTLCVNANLAILATPQSPVQTLTSAWTRTVVAEELFAEIPLVVFPALVLKDLPATPTPSVGTLTSVRTILVAKGPYVPTSQVAMNAPVHRGSRGIQLLKQVVLTSMNALLTPLDIIMWIITMPSPLLSVEVLPSVSILLAVTFASVRLDLQATQESRVSTLTSARQKRSAVQLPNV